ncbi:MULTISPECIES: translesion DNA synthesis-associated protein ImuA [unclassified Pseudomonas]|uniref:translesion DNA synthesis-associated protein ImuA n=1 Tax=unclassified Pseudomonas TaxID=196821 RepID=UPI001067812A|nr:translesion DNA synthesis-associated protein ImuA [Pseudomonas sp. SXM-1]QBQ10740.1 translesion DNA synthesis-associated protein ImuA [Pseudomonas sp. SXM-1]
MGAVVALDSLFNGGRVWKGRPAAPPASFHPTGLAALDAVLPSGGWPEAALSEILMAKEGVGELQLVWPTLARLAAAGERIVLVAPPYTPYPHAWQNAGVDVRQLSVIQADERDALWAVEQCLRSGSCGAVLCWPRRADDRALRRLQVAAETGQTLAFAWRSLSEAINPSPAALRLAVEASPAQVRVLKCRGGLAHPAPIALGH